MLGIASPVDIANAQSHTELPALTVVQPQPKQKRTARAAPERRSRAIVQRSRTAPPPQETAPTASQVDQKNGSIGYMATRTSSATKTDTPLINVPQSVTVLTKEFIRDQNFQSIGDAIRYVPGVVPNQGEGHRDQITMRGTTTTSDFYTNGIRDDVQYLRDLYNIQSIEVLKGPNALIFGRGGGGGVLNRVQKEADGVPIREVTVQGGSFANRRVSIDAGGAVNSNVAGRINAVYEKSDTFRDYVGYERYGINPTMTLRGDDTKVKLSYEYFHDKRTLDRGIPPMGTVPAATRFNPTVPFSTDPSTFFGNPDLSYARIDAHIADAVIEHDFNNGLQVRNSTRYGYYDKFNQQVYPGSAVNPANYTFSLRAFNNATTRQNLFNQTDWTYKTNTGPVLHTIVFGTEFGKQITDSFRSSGNPGTITGVSAFNPTIFTPVSFFHAPTDTNVLTTLNLASAYVQDQIEINRYFQVIAGVRFDRFDLSALDRNPGGKLTGRVDNLVSPRVGIVFKPVENVSIYGSYSLSYLPGGGNLEQFSSLSSIDAVLLPEKFINTEVGVKWDITPRTQFTAAVYNLDRENQRFVDVNSTVWSTGKTGTKGVEVGLTGYLTDAWQVSGGYAYTDSRITSDTSALIVKGNRVALVPYNTFTLWNKYQFNSMWAAGVGLIHYGDSYVQSDDVVKLPSFTRVDAAIYLNLNETWRAQLNIENIFNVGYFASAYPDNYNALPGAPRTFRVSATARF